MLAKITLSAILLSFGYNIYAQEIASADTIKSSVKLDIGFGYTPTTDYTNTQNTELISSPIVSPGIAYSHKSGFGLSLNSSFLLSNSNNQSLYEMIISPSYNYGKSKLYSLGASYSRFYYNKNSPIPQTPINNELYTFFSYDDLFIKPSIEFDYGFGTIKNAKVYSFKKKTSLGSQTISGHDLSVTLNASKSLSFDNLLTPEDELEVATKVSLISGTENFFRNLKTSKNLSRNKHFQDNSTSATSTDGSKFELRSFQTAVSLNYAIGKFNLIPQYDIAFPLSGDSKTPYGYFTANLQFTF